MPFFNFRRGSSTTAAGAAGPAESVEAMRKRAKHRLIGAVVLVLIGVIGFPLLFDTQPRPVAVDIPIEIPGKNTVKPLVMPAPPAIAPKVAASAPAAAPDKVAAPSSLTPREEIIADKPAAPATPAPPAIKTEVKPEPKAVAKTPASSDEAARAKALLEGKPVATATATAKVASADVEGRLVVQVGAFADEAKAREVRQKLERAGLKTYTQVADTKDGKRIRVRVGPFATRADADKAASKIKGLDLPAAILTL
ncbi:MAG: SPOR domain-containing protein [Polaromonas sp.]|nr:SPOR domain-containing protein [Polaromonas sp.]